MTSWYLFSIAALLLLGTQRFLYKVAAEQGCSSGLTTAVFMGTVTLISGAWFLFTGLTVSNLAPLVVLALINSISFAGATIAHIEALRHLPAGITFPLTRLSLVVVVLFSVGFFGERLSSVQWLGVLLGLVVVIVLSGDANREQRPKGNLKTGLVMVSICVLCGAIAAISSKLAAVSVGTAGFMAMSYLFGTVFSLTIDKNRGSLKNRGPMRQTVQIGILMGILNFFGFYAFLAALTRGPLSVVAMITGMHFVIAILLSVFLYRERLPWLRQLGIGLTFLEVLLLRQ